MDIGLFVAKCENGLLKKLRNFYELYLKHWGIKRNYYKTNYSKNVLISYILHPFQFGESKKNSNTKEAFIIAEVFKEFGYNVDIVHYTSVKKINLEKYNIIWGFGEQLELSYYKKCSAKKITYATGRHPFIQSMNSIDRIKQIEISKKVPFLAESGRICNTIHPCQNSVANAMIVLGSDYVQKSYAQFYSGPMYSQPVSFYEPFDTVNIIKKKDFNKTRSHYLWLGGHGLIHKGLDFLLDYFKDNPNLHLHVCGFLDREQRFCQIYFKELYNLPNIHTYGLVDITSNIFKGLLENCAYAILPSCSEADAGSMIMCMGHGLIPIIPDSAGIEHKDFSIKINELTLSGISSAINQSKNFATEQIESLALKVYDNMQKTHTSSVFKEKMISNLKMILETK